MLSHHTHTHTHVRSLSLSLSATRRLHDDPEFCFDWEEHRPFAEAAYRGDKRLHQLLPRLVPKRISEEDFWRNYFSHVFAVKRRFELGGDASHAALLTTTMSAPPTASTTGIGASGGPSTSREPLPGLDVTPATPTQSPMRPLSLTVSYPEKFHLALKYAEEGPPLPNLSDADRILLEALQQQATVGECNRPRPGMWDSAEEKAKYEAWKKLGSMSRAEAMHLYVQAIEVFDERWLEWKGLQAAIAAAVGAVTPVSTPRSSNGAANGGAAVNGGVAKGAIDVAATLGTMRQLRASLGALPPAQQQSLRDEAEALARALDAQLRAAPSTPR